MFCMICRNNYNAILEYIKMKKFCLILFLSLSSKGISGMDVIYPGDSDFCTEKLEEEAYCVEIKKCPIAKNLIRQGKTPMSCGFSGNIPFVCCAISSFSELNVTEFRPDNRNISGINNLEERDNERILFPANSTSIYGDSVIQPRSLNKSNTSELKSENWPWIISVIRKNDSVSICSGFLIDKLRIITAAHCYSNDGNAENYNVFALKNGRKTLYDITELRIHQDFHGYYHDVAVLKIYPEIPDVIPVCLPVDNPENNLLGKNAIILSWLDDDGYDGVVSHNMKIIEVQICNQVYSELADNPFPYGIKNGFICAFPVDLTRDICEVNTGGLLVMKEDKWSLLGIGTLRIPCHRPTYPAVYTNIYYYLNWLN